MLSFLYINSRSGSMFARINSMGLFGADSYMVGVEVDYGQGLPKIDLVGLPDTAVNESRNRVRSAIKNSGFTFPQSRLTINLSPADIRKEGPVYDLPIFIAVLRAGDQIRCRLDDCAFIGELSLDGLVRHVNGALPMVIRAKNSGIKHVFVPAENALESSVVEGINVYAVENVIQVTKHLTGEKLLEPVKFDPAKDDSSRLPLPDFKDVMGQEDAKYALEIAAAGGHNIIMVGPPGSGKSMLAKRLPSILPDMTFEESLETTELYSITGVLPKDVSLITSRPFRAPHHTVSPAGLSGGGPIPRPGEISLAHNGVLFLDELPEFRRDTLEVLRQPLEDGIITISRVNATLSYPCNIMLIAAMNPCPCGNRNNPNRVCTCTPAQVQRYRSKISAPLLDRIDIQIEVPAVEYDDLSKLADGDTSAQIKERVNKARKIQLDRYANDNITANSQLTAAMLDKYCALGEAESKLLKSAFDRLGLSARAHSKILKVARTIADLDGSDDIKTLHIAEAIQYRNFDRIGY
jgi:magnesium chelatase family protein